MGGQIFSFDLNGNLTSDGPTSYSWNARNQLTALSGGTNASFAYDTFGRRRGKTIGGTTTNFLYDGENAVQELTSGGTPTANMFTGLGLDQTFTRTDATGSSTLLIDALGSALALADASGSVQTQYSYEPFGATTPSGATSANSFQFTGRENDGTGLYFYRARFYSPAVQRFVSEDPIEFLGGLNLYEYAGSNPIRYKDPLGWSRKEDCPKCVDMFRDCLTDWLLPGLSNAIQGLMEAFANSASALLHALSRGLTYPQKSSIFRDIIKNSRWWTTISGAAGPAVFTAGVWYCLGKEMNALAHGECRP
jgi:RHS repeat-associated protein